LEESLTSALELENDNYVAIPYLYSVASIRAGKENRGGDAVIAGTHLYLLENREPGWKLQPEHPADYKPDECLAGARLANKLGVFPGANLQLEEGNRSERCKLVAVVSSGGAEDDEAFLPLEMTQGLTGMRDKVSLLKLFVNGPPPEVGERVSALQKKYGAAEIRPIRQFTEGESRLYGKISGILTATVGVVLLLTALCVMAAMTNVAMERKNDVGLMKAIGGSVRRVMRLFLMEAALLGLAGGVIGAAVGILLSIGLGKAVFGVAAQPRLVVYPVSVALTVIVAILAAFPLRRLAQIRPASVFRGEE
jgi:putative ABC transport system permease protein